MTLLNRIKCRWFGHKYETRWFDRSNLSKGSSYMKMGCNICSRCNEGIEDFNQRQLQINFHDSGRAAGEAKLTKEAEEYLRRFNDFN